MLQNSVYVLPSFVRTNVPKAAPSFIQHLIFPKKIAQPLSNIAQNQSYPKGLFSELNEMVF